MVKNDSLDRQNPYRTSCGWIDDFWFVGTNSTNFSCSLLEEMHTHVNWIWVRKRRKAEGRREKDSSVTGFSVRNKKKGGMFVLTFLEKTRRIKRWVIDGFARWPTLIGRIKLFYRKPESFLASYDHDLQLPRASWRAASSRRLGFLFSILILG